MIGLTQQTISLELNLSDALSTDWSVAWVDVDQTTSPPGQGFYNTNQSNVAVSGDTTMVVAPQNQHSIQVQFITVINRDASNQNVTISLHDFGFTPYQIAHALLKPGWKLSYQYAVGWEIFDENGVPVNTPPAVPGGTTGNIQWNNFGIFAGAPFINTDGTTLTFSTSTVGGGIIRGDDGSFISGSPSLDIYTPNALAGDANFITIKAGNTTSGNPGGIAIEAGFDSGGNTGGSITLLSGQNAFSASDGAVMNITGASSTTGGNFIANAGESPLIGGVMEFFGGAGISPSGTGGDLRLGGGSSLSSSGHAGDLHLIGGDAGNGGGTGRPGHVFITGGVTSNSQNGGDVHFTAGTSSGGNPGSIFIEGQVNVNSSVGTTGQVLASRGANLSPIWGPSGLTQNIISVPTTIPADTSYVVVDYLTITSIFNVLGNTRIL